MGLQTIQQYITIIKLAWKYRHFLFILFRDLGPIANDVSRVKKAYEDGNDGLRRGQDGIRSLLRRESFCELVKLTETVKDDAALQSLKKYVDNDKIFKLAWYITVGDWDFMTEISTHIKDFISRIGKRFPFIRPIRSQAQTNHGTLFIPEELEEGVIDSIGLLYLVISILPVILLVLSFRQQRVD